MLMRLERFTSTAIDDLRVSFTCSACNATAEADVMTASSSATEMPILVSESLRDMTRNEAVAGLPEAARQAVGLAGCPSCDAMDAGVARSARITAGFAAIPTWYGIGAIVLAAILGTIGTAAESLVTRVITSALAVGILVLATGLGGRAKFAEKRRAAAARVTWRRPDAA